MGANAMFTSPKAFRTARSCSRNTSGSVIVIGLLLLAMVTLGLAAWISLITTRSYLVEQMEATVKRRVAYSNANALAKEYVYQKALGKSSGSAVHIELSGGMGGVDIPAWTGAPLASNSIPGSVNRIGPADGFGFTKDLPVTISNGTESTVRNYQMRSRSPMLGGDLLCYQNPAINTSDVVLKGNIHIYGRSQIAVPGLISGYTIGEFRSTRYNVPSLGTTSFQVLDTGGAVTLPSNFPPLPVTAGVVGSGLGYDGKASTVNNTVSPFNSLYHKITSTSHIVVRGDVSSNNRGVVCDGNGVITVDLSDATLTNVFFDSNIRRITLTGQDRTTSSGLATFTAAENLPAVAFVVLQDSSSTRNLEWVRMEYSNARRLIMAMKVPSGDDEVEYEWRQSESNPEWRMILVGESMRFRLILRNNGVVTLKGGIRNDRRLEMDTSSSKILRIVRETNPQSLLEALADRNAWLESYDGGGVAPGSDPFATYNAPYVGPGGPAGGGSGGSGGGGSGGGGGGGSGTSGDVTPPTVILTTSSTSVAGSFSVNVSFNETVTGVGPTDFLITNGSVGTVSGSGSAYVITVNPTRLGPVAVTMASGTANDLAGNPNSASNTLLTTFAGPIILFEETFNAGSTNWTYFDDAFRGTSQANYATGGHSASYGEGGTAGVQVYLGAVNDNDINNMSGAWRRSFTLDVSSRVEVRFSYNLSHSSEFESDEYGEALIAINGGLIYLNGNDYLARFYGDGNGGSVMTTGWRTLTLPLGVLPAGNHTLALGGFLNRKTLSDEWTSIRFDNVKVTAAYP